MLTTKPDWVTEAIPANDGDYSSPAFLSSRILYYSVSGGEDVQCIGRATAYGDGPNITWTDSGSPVTCTYNTKEKSKTDKPWSAHPAVFVDDTDSHYLVYGGGTIWLTQLDPATGRQIEDNFWSHNDTSYSFLAKGPILSKNTDENEWIEAPFIHKKDGFYYLLITSFESVDFPHKIRVGRATNVTGPYIDKEGVDMKDGGGSVLMKENGRDNIGVGRAAVFTEGGRDWLSYHYYDGYYAGLPWVEVRRLDWEEGWPLVTQERFNSSTYKPSKL